MAEKNDTFTLEDEGMELETVVELADIGPWFGKKFLDRKEALALYNACGDEINKLVAIAKEKNWENAGYTSRVVQVEGYNRWMLRGMPTYGYVLQHTVSPSTGPGPETIYVRYFLFGDTLGRVVGFEKIEEKDYA